MGLRVDLDRCGKSRLHWDSIPGPFSPQAVAIPTTLPGPLLLIMIIQNADSFKACNMSAQMQLCLFVFLALQPIVGVHFHSPVAGFSLLIFEVSRSHTTTRHSRQDSSGRVFNPSQRPLPDNTQHSQQTNIHAPTISAGERPQTYALDRAATGTGYATPYKAKYAGSNYEFKRQHSQVQHRRFYMLRHLYVEFIAIGSLNNLENTLTKYQTINLKHRDFYSTRILLM